MRPSFTCRWYQLALTLFCALLLGSERFTHADTVTLTNGSKIDGTVLKESATEVVLQVGTLGVVRLQKDTISAVEKNRRTGVVKKRPDSDKPRKKNVNQKGEVKSEKKSALTSITGVKVSQSLKTHLDDPLVAFTGKQKLEVEQWVEDLQRQRVNYRSRAERKLKETGPRVVPLLQSVAQSQFALTRVCALRVLNQFPRYESMSAALAGLDSDDPWVRKLSSELAAKISGDRRPFPWKDAGASAERSRAKSEWSLWYQQQESLRLKIEAELKVPNQSGKDRKNQR